MMINILIFEAQKFTLYKNKKATSLRDGYMIVSFKRTFYLFATFSFFYRLLQDSWLKVNTFF